MIVFKGLSVIYCNPKCYPEFCFPFDSTLPIVVVLSNYFLLQKSDHPFAIKIREDWPVICKGLLVLYSSAFFTVLPSPYHIAWLSYLSLIHI